MLKPILYIAVGIVFALLTRWAWAHIWSFPAQSPEDYADQAPAFDIREILNGPMKTEGVIYDYTGRVATRFVADMAANWDGDVGVMTEHFTYQNGRTQNRRWSLKMIDDTTFVATAPDIIGTARGKQIGNAVRLLYRIKLDEAAGGHELDVVDWMYLLSNGVVMNRSEFRKFGIKVGELVATFRPVN